MLIFRGYQEEAISIGLDVLRDTKPRKELFIEPTAAGKSIIIAEIAKQLNAPLLCIQPSKELLEQNFEKSTNIGSKATLFSASVNSKEVSNLTFATIGSLKNAVDQFKKIGLKHIIIDEVHLGSKSGSILRDFIKKCGITHILGFTATPIYLLGGLQGSELKIMTKTRESMFKSIAHITQISHLVNKNYWSKLNYKVLEQDESFLEVNSSGADFKEESLKKFYSENDIEQQTINEVKEAINSGRKSILVFCPTIESAIDLSNKIPGSEVVHSKLEKKHREDVLKRFKSLKTKVVINVSVLSTGFDHPELDTVILTRPTMSIALYYQIFGRAVRIHKNKKDALLVDLSNSFKKFGKLEDLNFEYIDNYGWGLFSKDTLLTNFPLKALNRPTKQTLFNKYNIPKNLDFSDEFFTFGKYKGKKVTDVYKQDKGYLSWLIDNKDFKWQGDKMNRLKKSIMYVLDLC